MVLVQWPPVQAERWQLGAHPSLPSTHAQHQKAVAHLTPQEWAELVLSVQGPVQLVMLEVALTMTKDRLVSDFCSDVEKTVFWLL